MNFSEIDSRKVAAELFSCSVCNLNCSYCYIPKNKMMQEYNKQILKKLTDGTFIEELKRVYGEELSTIGLWGTEPTLIIHKFTEVLDSYFDAFPKLNTISFSTNNIAYPERIVELATKLNEVGKARERNIFLNFQTSLDGPPWVTDKTRGDGSTKKIRENAISTIKGIKVLNLEMLHVIYSVKPTVDIESIALMNADTSLISEWYIFFDNMFDEMINSSGTTEIRINSCASPTLVVPGKYTKEDGLELAKFYRNLRLMEDKISLKYVERPLNGYVHGIRKAIQEIHNFRNKTYATTCSGGDSQLGVTVDGMVTQCHRTFLFDNEKYINTVLSETNDIDNKSIEDWDTSKFDSGIVEKISRYLTVNSQASEKEKARYVYMMRSYHDNAYGRISQVISMLKELALCDQADLVYLEDDNLCLLFSLFVNSRFSCPVENYLQSGSLNITPVSIIRVLANGAFIEMMMHYFKGGN